MVGASFTAWGARRLSEKWPARHPPPHRRDGIAGERGRPARILVPLAAAELQCDAAGSHPVCGNSIGQAEGKPWHHSRLIQVGEMAGPVTGFVRAGRPRSQESSHDITFLTYTPAPGCPAKPIRTKPNVMGGNSRVFDRQRLRYYIVAARIQRSKSAKLMILQNINKEDLKS